MRKYLAEMLRHARRIESYIAGKTVEQFLGDQLLLDAISMNFVVIGEALTNVKKQDRTTAELVSEWNRIIGFRNQLVHGYSEIDDEIIWKIIQDKIPILLADLTRLLAAGDEPV